MGRTPGLLVAAIKARGGEVVGSEAISR